MGVDVVTRQTLWKGQYGLLDGDLTFNPRPDYWMTLLFKRLVGRKVLKVRVIQRHFISEKLIERERKVWSIKFRNGQRCVKNGPPILDRNSL